MRPVARQRMAPRRAHGSRAPLTRRNCPGLAKRCRLSPRAGSRARPAPAERRAFRRFPRRQPRARSPRIEAARRARLRCETRGRGGSYGALAGEERTRTPFILGPAGRQHGVEPWTGVRNALGAERPRRRMERGRPGLLLPFQHRQGDRRRGRGRLGRPIRTRPTRPAAGSASTSRRSAAAAAAA